MRLRFLTSKSSHNRAATHGDQGSAAKWTHAAMSLAIRALGDGESVGRPDPGAVLKICERVMSEGNIRRGNNHHDLGPQDALALLRAARIAAGLRGAQFVTPDDVKTAVPLVMPHRLTLASEALLEGTTELSVTQRLLEQVPVPR